ncbi:RES family NAD+ phosphorylase [Asaia spathodeae]|uniref:RES family NAD+ phosphorylase n=1 Tax=Asaia spathodeae TaxID=657016 RepID=UPI002FC385A2
MKTTTLCERGLIRLIPATYHKPPTLRGLVDTDAEAALLAEVEAMTSGRLIAEAGRNRHLDSRELAWQRRNNDMRVYGVSHINAAFTYTRTGGSRFNSEARGAWYCAWTLPTAIDEVAFHKVRELAYVNVFKDKTRYVELLADFIGEFPDITDEADSPCLSPDANIGYPAGQKLALDLQREGARGLIYPSVRHPDGQCLVVFSPSAIQNVRPGAQWDLEWDGSPEFTMVGV